MDTVYHFGVGIIQIIQRKFANHEDFFTTVNNLADPHYTLTLMFPIIAAFDSVYASEFLLVTTFGGWLNSILKWILMEHRPFWWVRETQYYGPMKADKPILRAGPQTCETGPGSPSGHLMSCASVLALLISWIMAYRMARGVIRRSDTWLKWTLWLLSGVTLTTVASARLFVATHFPHQCLLGAAFGFLTAYFISNFLVYPFLNSEYEFKLKHSSDIREVDQCKRPDGKPCSYISQLRWRMVFHVMMAVYLILLAFAIYWGQKYFGFDPLWTVKLAFKWCPAPEFLHFNTTPLYALVESTGSILGWAICVTPSVKSYRYNEGKRSLIIAAISAGIFQQVFSQWQSSISRVNATYFYLMNFFAFTLRPLFFIRLVPLLGMCTNKWRERRTRTADATANVSRRVKTD